MGGSGPGRSTVALPTAVSVEDVQVSSPRSGKLPLSTDWI